MNEQKASSYTHKINLGRQGENNATKVIFTPAAPIEEGTTFLLFNVRPKEKGGTYPVPVTVDEDKVIWLVSSFDTQNYGDGQCQLTQYDGEGQIVKTTIWNTYIEKSLDQPGPVPAPVAPWLEQFKEEVRAMIENVIPAEGTDGNVLAKTADGSEWIAVAKSVNGQTGNVELDASNLEYVEGTTIKQELDSKVNTEAFATAIQEVSHSINVVASELNSHIADDTIHISQNDRDIWDNKQSRISDLDSIREGAQLGMTALQDESDPTVPNWAKQPTKPAYTAEEVHALPDTTPIPRELNQLLPDESHMTVGQYEKDEWNAKVSQSDLNKKADKTQLPFIATYGVTSYQEIANAKKDGRIIQCMLGDFQYELARVTSSAVYFYLYFDLIQVAQSLMVTSANQWSINQVKLENTANKTTYLNSGSTDEQYPSARVVYNELQKKLNQQFPIADKGKILGIGNDGKVVAINSNWEERIKTLENIVATL